MYTVSSEIRERITSDLYDLMVGEEYDVDYGVVRDIVNMGIDMRCESGVYDILATDENWDPEKLCIFGKRGFERKFNACAIKDFWYLVENWIIDANKCVPYNTYYRDPADELIEADEANKDYWEQRARLQEVMEFFHRIGGQFFNEEMKESIDHLNSLNDNYKLRTNMKTSKAILKICKEEKWDLLGGKYIDRNGNEKNVFDQKYAELSDAINPITINLPFVLSGNPCDFFTQSWLLNASSCHCTKRDHIGEWSAGTTSYWLAPESLVFAKLDRNWGAGFNTHYDSMPWYRVPKEERQMFGMSAGGVIIQSRLYPQNNDYNADDIYLEIREYVQGIVAKALGEPNRWETKKTVKENELRNLVIETDSDSCAYEDWEPGCPGSQHVRVSRLKTKEWIPIRFAGQPICPSCGNEMSEYEHGNILCEDCHEVGTRCECCGRRFDDYDLEWCEDVEEYRCPDCRFYCEHCETYHGDRDYEVEVRVGRWNEYWCTECVEYDAFYCEECGEYHHIDDIVYIESRDINICCSCEEDLCFTCPECGEVFFRDDMKFLDGVPYCENCYDEKVNEEEA